jgi:hypothetical protein
LVANHLILNSFIVITGPFLSEKALSQGVPKSELNALVRNGRVILKDTGQTVSVNDCRGAPVPGMQAVVVVFVVLFFFVTCYS